MRKAFAKNLGSWFVLLATAGGLAVLTCFVAGAYLMTFPLHRKMPRQQKVVAMAELSAAVMSLVAAFNRDTSARPDDGSQ